ncbi:MAG: glycosyltransferase [Ndongobacter sp.]|nr:glycosyltransferase [Ndongobacter sp.]
MEDATRERISVIIPVYNAAMRLPGCLDRLSKQTYRELEILLIDDGSTDGSGRICDEAAERDPRVRAIHQENAGAGAARNRGIEEATGAFLLFLDGDDTYEPDLAEILVREAIRGDADVVVCGFTYNIAGEPSVSRTPGERLLASQSEVHQWIGERFPDGMAGYPWNKLYRRALIEAHHLRYPALKRYQDGVFNLEVFDCAQRVRLVDRVLYHYRANETGEIYQKNPKNIWQLVEELAARFEAKRVKWGKERSASEGMDAFLQSSAIMALENAFSDAWKMDAAQRRDYFAELQNSAALQAAMAHREPDNFYYRQALHALRSGRFRRLSRIVQMKMMCKKQAKALFSLLKNRKKGIASE